MDAARLRSKAQLAYRTLIVKTSAHCIRIGDSTTRVEFAQSLVGGHLSAVTMAIERSRLACTG